MAPRRSTTRVQGLKKNASELFEAVAAATGTTKAEARKTIDATFAAIGDAIADEKEVAIAGFGKFKPKLKAARDARNPRTGDIISIAASKGVGFAPAKALRDKINSG